MHDAIVFDWYSYQYPLNSITIFDLESIYFGYEW